MFYKSAQKRRVNVFEYKKLHIQTHEMHILYGCLQLKQKIFAIDTIITFNSDRMKIYGCYVFLLPPLILAHTHTPIEFILCHTFLFLLSSWFCVRIKSSNNETAEYLIKIAYRRARRGERKRNKCELCVAIECVNDVVIWYTSFVPW